MHLVKITRYAIGASFFEFFGYALGFYEELECAAWAVAFEDSGVGGRG